MKFMNMKEQYKCLHEVLAICRNLPELVAPVDGDAERLADELLLVVAQF